MGSQMLLMGTITRVLLPRGFGFIRGDDGQDYFLQADELHDVPWSGETVREGMRVQFEPTTRGAKGNGKRAAAVRIL